jgi:hypothetical protein
VPCCARALRRFALHVSLQLMCPTVTCFKPRIDCVTHSYLIIDGVKSQRVKEMKGLSRQNISEI